MNECVSGIVTHPASTDDRMRRDVAINITTRVTMDEIESLPTSKDRSMKSFPLPGLVTDGSEAEINQSDDNILPVKRGLKRAGPCLHEEQSSSICSTTGATSETMPQHEQLEDMQPLDISYQFTEMSLKVKKVLLTRLTDAVPTGVLQLVRASEGDLGVHVSLLFAFIFVFAYAHCCLFRWTYQ
jgi:hypothetical protein